MKNIIEEIKDMALKQEQEESGFCPSSGTYRSKWPLPQAHDSSSSSFPLYLFSRFPSHPASTTKPALIDATTGHSLTFAELRSLTVSVADSLRSSLGVNKGDVVLLVSPNSVHFPAILLAIMSLGAVFSTTNFLNTTEEIQAQVHDLNPVLIVTTRVLQTKLQGLVSRPPLLIIESFVASLALQERPPCRNMPRAEEIASHDTAMVLYSSGTTGRSKGVILSHGSMIAISAAVGQVWTGGAGTAADHVHMCVAPLFHMYGIAMLLCGAIGVGSTGVVMSKYETGKMVAAAERYGVTRVTLTPPVIVQMVKLVAGERRRVMGTWGSVKEVISSGAPLAKEYLNRFRKSFPNITLSQSYGLTEVGPITLCDGLESRSDASAGRLIPSLEARVVDIGTRKALPPNKCGELHVRGPSVMRGYWRDKEATSLAIDREGWLNTGDLCFIDTSGRLHVMDRIKEFIKYKAYQVSPAELEDILTAHPEISDAAVVPYEDEESGQIPVACIVRNPGSKIQAEEIISFMATKVAHYKKIRKVAFVESVPRTASGKKLRRELKAAIVGNNLLRITPKL